ncbi:hypothetical protein GCM10010371_59860 [Streptomyces subrutilus]|uniref:CAP domain-containing protein n=1 Tax=Streptomyces subrutilus TaxID=36818 RepID=A0A5P2UTK8_9ACTN|nr:CAP domain-containing protein [Streptomyces subrutilus]QEU82210.1 CAP domain-containing protein [Streptomyces subrutilus]GGZ92138.1 hypothetical protein GCM10010371_59860 [Streptomyces subrutilus]
MRKHRKSRRYKKISIAAVALGIVGVPTAALACLDGRGTGGATADGGQDLRAAHAGAPLRSPAGGQATQVQTPAPTAPTAPTPVATTATPTAPAAPAPRATTDPPQRTQPPVTSAQPAKPHRAPARTTAPAAPKAPAAPPAPAASGPAAEVVALVNAERAKAGCSVLTVNPKLTAAALAHSKDMAATATMSHTGSDGSDPGARITRAGYAWTTYGENVAYGYSSPQQVMTGWMNSPGHRENILNCSFKEIGVALAQPNAYWTQSFGAAR